MESFDVLIVGGGISGIGAACHLVMEGAGRSFVMLEARDRVGGTWDLFRYPGVRSDSDMFTFGYGFYPWTSERDIAEGDAILEYLDNTVDAYKLRPHIRLRHRVETLSWSSEHRRWRAEVQRLDAEGEVAEVVEIEARFLVTGTGYYRYDQGYTPDWPGLDAFGGEVIHPQHWRDTPLEGRKVVVIGSGATAVTLIPHLTKAGAKVTMLQRSPTYMVSRPSRDAVAQSLAQILPASWAFRLTRLKNIFRQWVFLRLARNAPQFVRKTIRSQAEAALGSGVDVETHFTPRYEPWDQRLCLVPDGDFFAALEGGDAEVVTEEIDTFEADGIKLRSGRTLEADLVVPATGLRLKFLSNIALDVDGHPVRPNGLVVYKGAMFGNMPNWVSVFGYTAASWTLKADLTSQYLIRLLKFMDRKGYEVVRPELDPALSAPDSLMQNIGSAGYVQRGRDQLPRQARSWPWRNLDNYALDYLALRWGRIADGVLRFEARSADSAKSFSLRGKTAVVTGAASGIGRALAFALARRGCHLALVDVSEDGLEETTEGLRDVPVRVSSHVCDMGEPEAVQSLSKSLSASHASIDVLINNAGIGMAGRFADADADEFQRVLSVNLLGPINLTRALLPQLMDRASAHIVNISSVFGLVAPPGQVAYCTSKFGLRGFSEALRRELSETTVGLTTVHPGGVQTRVARDALIPRRLDISADDKERRVRRIEEQFKTSPQQAAELILDAVQRRQARLLIGNDARMLAAAERLSPTRNLEWLGSFLHGKTKAGSKSASPEHAQSP